jgi:glucose 1-dehydrogenase
VNISSIHEDFTFPSYTPCAAAKGGLRVLMRNAALELVSSGSGSTISRPARSRRPSTRPRWRIQRRFSDSGRSCLSSGSGRPEEVAEVALCLASERSSYVTGSTYFVDGGIVRYAEPL